MTRPRDKSALWEPTHAPAPLAAVRPTRGTWPSALLLAAVTACANHPPTGPATAPDPGDHRSPATTGNQYESNLPPGISQQQAAEQTRKIMEAVAKARALPVTGEVQVAVMRRADIRDYAKASMYEHNTPEQIRLFTRIEASMGVLPVGANGEAILLDMLESGVMGLYEPKNRTLYIGTHVSEGQLDMVVGHEIAHGLQDMHFGLKRLQEPIRGDSDAESARTYLVEGDAQAAYLAWVSGDGGLANISPEVFLATGNQALDLADLVDYPVLARSLQLPYADGAATIAALVRERGWPAVDALYKQLPTTTEQMLHIDKLLAREAPIAVVADQDVIDRSIPGHKVVWQDNVGEASLLAMLADVEPSPIARAAAAGWGGDRYLVLEQQPQGLAPIVVGLIAWDSEKDAAEFDETFRLYLEKTMPAAFVLERRGAQVLYASQVRDPATRAALSTHAWTAFTVAGKPAGTGKPTSTSKPVSKGKAS